MDFRPTRRTLILNYIVVAAILTALLLAGRRYAARVYYWPEYTSHTGYTTPGQTCQQCHVQPFQPFQERTCYTGGCHAEFDPRQLPLSATSLGEWEGRIRSGEGPSGVQPNRPSAVHFAAVVQFHRHLRGAATCVECHPAHQLPQKGRFNEFTIRAELEKRILALSSPKPEDLARLRAEIFHNESRSFIGTVACDQCHVGMQQPPEAPPPPREAPPPQANRQRDRWIIAGATQ